MYDVMLRDDLLNLNKNLYNIDTINYRRAEMKKIISNRTQDKLWLLNYLLGVGVIDNTWYEELLHRVEIDYKTALSYLFGLCKI